MQLKVIVAALAGVVLLTAAAQAQSLSPMHKSGQTPSDVKGFKLLVGNPYKQAMTFIVMPMDTAFGALAEHAVTRPAEFRLGAGQQRSVTVAFKIAPGEKERTIGVCVQPKEIEGSVLPRVCGTYTGTKLIPDAGG
jgi:hypothetical protein